MDKRAGEGDFVGNTEESEYTEISVLWKDQTFLYIIPSLPVHKAILQEVRLQQDDGLGNVYMFDGFARKSHLLDHPLLAIATIPYSYENAFIINVSCKCMTGF